MAVRGQAYVYGNTVLQPEVAPQRRREREQPKRPRRVSKQVRKNQKKAMHMSASYVVFLAVAAVIMLCACTQYLQLQSQINKRSQHITSLQQELASTKEENNTMYNAIIDSVNLENVRNVAVNELGMVNVEPEQIIEYPSESGDYVKQYQNIPKSGVLAQSSHVAQ
ncbi:MAG: hypothetical protein RRY06_03245 [Lachnospiraceae bacterium]